LSKQRLVPLGHGAIGKLQHKFGAVHLKYIGL